MDKVIFNAERPTTRVKLPSTGITIEIYSSLLIVDADILNAKDIVDGSIEQTKKIFTKLIKSWNWYKAAEDAEALPITEENVGLIHAEDIPVITEAIEAFRKEQKKS